MGGGAAIVVESVVHFPILLNALGHVAGGVAFGAFLFLLIRGARGAVLVPATAAGLALGWNLGSLAVLLAEPGSRTQALVAAASFAVLSLLPSALLQLALRGEAPWLMRIGYAVGAGAAAAHLLHAAGIPGVALEAGFVTINYGFGLLAVAAAVLLARKGPNRRVAGMRALGAMALFLLAASFVHFGSAHDSGTWFHELAFHHAGIPLALFVLSQDYRFLLLDVFVRLAGAGLLAASFAGALLWLAETLGLARAGEATAASLAVFLLAASLLIFAYPRVIRQLGQRMQNALFGRKDAKETARAIHALRLPNEAMFLERASRSIAEFVSANRWRLLEEGDACGVAKAEIAPAPCFGTLSAQGYGWAAAALPLRIRSGAARTLLLGDREGGRRYLSGDVADLETLAAEVAVRLEEMRRDEQDGLLREAEMAALRAQINPHFLFNALNALNALMPDSAAAARETLVNLAEIFRYALEGERQFVSLDDEIRIVDAYLQIERLRLGERLQTRVEVDSRARGLPVPALSIQPLVENAVKHGVSAKPEGGEVQVVARTEDGWLRVEVKDDGAGFGPDRGAAQGHGLQSVERRLQLGYGEAVEFRIDSGPGGTRVGFRVPVREG